MPDDPGSEPIPTATPDTSADDEPTGTAGQVAESAAEIALGAVIAPFTGGETVTMVESIRETVEEGIDQLTHLRHHDAPPDDDEDKPAGDEGGSEPPSFYSPDTAIDVPADDGRE
ncbi:MAG: hypothetical protein ACHQ3P_10320 [Candidatus Limnocylindrales bacterium]